MHLVCLVEHSMGDYEKISDWIHSIPLKNKQGRETHACPREVRLIDVVLDESCVDEFLSYLNLTSGHISSKKMEFMKSMICKMTPLNKVDISKIEQKKVNMNRPDQTFSYFQVLGSIPDNKNKEGMDLL